MPSILRKSFSDLTAAALREGLAHRRWHDHLPGVRPLSAELGVSIKTLRKALSELEAAGMIGPGRAGAQRQILLAGKAVAPKARKTLHIALALSRPVAEESADTQSVLLRLIDSIHGDGHRVSTIILPPGVDMGKTGRLPRLLANTAADAWILYRGSAALLDWFAAQPVPILVCAGRARDTALPAIRCDASQALRDAVRHLAAQGHRRIVMICPHRSLTPTPVDFVEAFRDELRRAGINPGEYNTPLWENSPEGLLALLDSLFRVTPPTALILMDNLYVIGALAFFARRGLEVPRDISLISADLEAAFGWHQPGLTLAHLNDQRHLLLRRIVRWIGELAANDLVGRPEPVEAIFIRGNSTGLAVRPSR